ncbi:HBL070Wp [Eremothecium sinecaudum]|uniref:Glutamate--tRNA ligase, mitochondrial n=1 Tax=Eremothecium sinecaudum TaxID=45286 RepID=A0A109UX96_9SACH|nr:HBL070Wp [Eremothecium sinecaudum]AMD18832.1 HBL070Wp [Eremothecium sinecaudum]
MVLLTLTRPASSLVTPKKVLSSLKNLPSTRKSAKDVHPKTPARTRFAPSPTGFLHLGSLRTALYNYLLAKNTGGQFLLRLEDTDRKRLVPGAEENIYNTLRWAGIKYDEGPGVNEVYGPYRQSERTGIYAKYSELLIKSGHAYRCFCTKERLNSLKESAMALIPPTTVTYDRKCAKLSAEEEQELLNRKIPYTIRFRSPKVYDTFHDLLHGELNLQPQVNLSDIRYDDIILVKSDNLPTYHFANVVDDHLMKITHVVRGEEWMLSTPKHIALYKAFGWQPPQFVHIPLLTTTGDKKLSKRNRDTNIDSLREKGFLPEALVNFCVLFGWSAPRELAEAQRECFTLSELETLFSLNYLAKGNAKVDDSKLLFFNKHYMTSRLKDADQLKELSLNLYIKLRNKYPELSPSKVENIVKVIGPNLTTIYDAETQFQYLFTKPNYANNKHFDEFKANYNKQDVDAVLSKFQCRLTDDNMNNLINEIAKQDKIPKKMIFECLRFALAASCPGLKLPALASLLGIEESKCRILDALHMEL